MGRFWNSSYLHLDATSWNKRRNSLTLKYLLWGSFPVCLSEFWEILLGPCCYLTTSWFLRGMVLCAMYIVSLRVITFRKNACKDGSCWYLFWLFPEQSITELEVLIFKWRCLQKLGTPNNLPRMINFTLNFPWIWASTSWLITVITHNWSLKCLEQLPADH